MEIIMIYASNCEKCASMRQTINSVIKNLSIDAELFVYNCKDPESIDIAIEYNISDIPGCNIGNVIIEGEDYDNEELVNVLKNLPKKINDRL